MAALLDCKLTGSYPGLILDGSGGRVGNVKGLVLQKFCKI